MALDALVVRRGDKEEHGLLPVQVFTGTGQNPQTRLKVEDTHTGFVEGRDFRTFYELSIPQGDTHVLRFIAGGDFILEEQNFRIGAGHLRFSAAIGGTPGGVFTPLAPVGANRMASRPTPLYEPHSYVEAGGTHTGGTEVEVVRIKTSDNTNFASTVGQGSTVRGLPAGTYYLRFQNIGTGTLTGTYDIRWEEVAAPSSELY